MGLPSKAVTASNICLKDKNEIVFNATKNCSISKNYFSSLAHNLVSKLPLAPNIFTESIIASYYDNNTVPKDLDFQLSETSPEKILSILKSLNPSKTAGFDNLSGKFLKDIALMFDQYLNFAIFLLNSIPFQEVAKIIERIVHDQTEEFLSKNKLLYRFQSGFLKNYSTNTCL